MTNRMDYSIQNEFELVSGTLPRVVSEKDFYGMKSSYDLCMYFLWIEEKMHMLLANYYEWENELVMVSDNITIEKDDKKRIEIGNVQIIEFNRLLNNLLSSVKLYQDQLYSTLSYIDKRNGTCFEKNMKQCSNDLCDESVEYQLLELLRNYMQHQGFIIERITIPFFSCETEYLLFHVEASISGITGIEKYKQKIKKKDLFEKGYK